MNYRTIDLPQGSDEWKEYRKTRIGASDAPSIAGVGFCSPYELWLEKLGFKERETHFGMKRGTELEPIARQEFIKKTGILVAPSVVESIENPWQIASLDGLDFEEKHAVEIKVPNVDDHRLALNGVVPEKYIPQLQHQMFILKIPMIFYYSYLPDSQALIEVPFDESYATELFKKEQEFLECLQELNPPALTQRDYNVRNDQEFLDAAHQYQEIVKKRKEIELEEISARKRCIELSGDMNSKGGGISVFKVVKKGNVDYKSIPELENVDLEKYRKKPNEYWVVR